MPSAERQRAELFEAFVPTVGREAAAMLLDQLPPTGAELATREHVEALERRMDDRLSALERRMDDGLHGVRDELLAAFRGELVAAVSGQTRQVIVATATAVFGIGGLAVTLAQVL